MMRFIKKIILVFTILPLFSCVNYKIDKPETIKEKKYYNSKGFALIYDDQLYLQGLVNKKIKSDQIGLLHNSLKKNTIIEITNPDSLISIEARVISKADYPSIFNVVISKEIANMIKLNPENPFVQLNEVKKNKTFVIKKANTFESEKNVAQKLPIDEVKIDDLTKVISKEKNIEVTEKIKTNIFVIVISDFYYYDSANNLKNELSKQTNIDNFVITKINNNKYRLSVGPFNSFNSLKSSYISLNNLGFEELNINRE